MLTNLVKDYILFARISPHTSNHFMTLCTNNLLNSLISQSYQALGSYAKQYSHDSFVLEKFVEPLISVDPSTDLCCLEFILIP